jgi:glycosyltransferase involved in cell wall biosynthesis
MACGTPVIARHIEGITDYIIKNEEDGFIIDSDDPIEFANSFIDLYENKLYYKTV